MAGLECSVSKCFHIIKDIWIWSCKEHENHNTLEERFRLITF